MAKSASTPAKTPRKRLEMGFPTAVTTTCIFFSSAFSSGLMPCTTEPATEAVTEPTSLQCSEASEEGPLETPRPGQPGALTSCFIGL